MVSPCNAIQYNTIQCNAMQYNKMQYNTIAKALTPLSPKNVMQSTVTIQCNAVSYNIVHAVKYLAIQYSTVCVQNTGFIQCHAVSETKSYRIILQYNVVQCTVTQYNKV